MKKFVRACPVFICLMLAACGPRDIGIGTSSEYEGDGLRPSTAEQMRYPMTGASSVQRNLYHYNRPHIMQNMQEWRVDQLRQQLRGQEPAPEDPAYRAVPRERSPFRQ